MSTDGNAITLAEQDAGVSPTGRQCLLVLLRPQLALAKNLQWPLKGFVSDGKRYSDLGLGDWTEFYDWLRDSDGNVLGVRYWLRVDTEFLINYAKGMDYVQADSLRHIEIYFSERRRTNPQLSCDQDFLYDAVFCSDDGEYAIAFGTGGMSESDLRSLGNLEAVWVDVNIE
jgi:hypothetical protein